MDIKMIVKCFIIASTISCTNTVLEPLPNPPPNISYEPEVTAPSEELNFDKELINLVVRLVNTKIITEADVQELSVLLGIVHTKSIDKEVCGKYLHVLLKAVDIASQNPKIKLGEEKIINLEINTKKYCDATI